MGERVTIGWFGGSCRVCEFCRAGDVVHCRERMVPGLSYPGGWAETVAVPMDALARIPEGLDFVDAAPLGCAGVTTFNAIRRGATPRGGRVAVFGLGHLAVQFAATMGYDVTAIARGDSRTALAIELGAQRYIDSSAVSPGAALRKTGGVDLIVSTTPTTAPVSELIDGLRPHGRLTLLGIDGGALEIPAARLATQSITLTGSLPGGTLDIEQTMRFALLNDARPYVECLPLESAAEAVARVEAGLPRFRTVLDVTDAR